MIGTYGKAYKTGATGATGATDMSFMPSILVGVGFASTAPTPLLIALFTSD